MLNRKSASIPDAAAIEAAQPRSLMPALACALALLAIVSAEGMRWSTSPAQTTAPALIATAAPGKITFTKVSSSIIPMPAGVPSAHASAMASLPGDQMMAFWWAGSRESGPDVKVYAARFTAGSWGQPRLIASRETLAAALGFGVRRIGNPVSWTAPDGKIHLYVVATGLGGWAAARTVQMVSNDHGETFKVRRVLPMSPLFNTSVLVRTSPVALADGGWWLPAYFEIGIKYPMLMAFDNQGNPRWVARIGARTTSLQPALVPVSGLEAYAWMRDASPERKVQQAFSRDGGASWEDMDALDLPNHASSVAAKRLTKGGYLLVHNHVEPGGTERNVLRLSLSKDARAWEHVLDVENGKAGEEFSYPTLQQIGDEMHITYTLRRTAIAHHVYRINYGEGL
jgi:predicted neuraminidase